MEAIIISPALDLMTIYQGRPFMSYQLEYWASQGVDRFLIPILPAQTSIRDYFGKQFRGVELEYITVRRDVGNGGLLLLTAPHALDESILVLSGRGFAETDLKATAKFHKTKGADVTVVVTQRRKVERASDVELKSDGRVSKLEGKDLLNSGTYLFERDSLKDLPFERGDMLTIEYSLLNHFLGKKDALYGYKTKGNLIEVEANDFKRTEEMILSISQKAA